MNRPDANRFIARHLHWIELERQAEIDATLQAQTELSAAQLQQRGLCLARLRVREQSSAFGGRIRLELEASTGIMPAHRMRPGDIVSIRAARGPTDPASVPSGVVQRVRADSIAVVLDDVGDDLPELLRLDRVAPDVTYQRMRRALRALDTDAIGPAQRLRDVALNDRPPEVDDPPRHEPAFAATLDDSQREAVALALRTRDFALVHGPPGTGKTTALTEIIRQAVLRGDRVLATAPSNIAVDNLVERLAAAKLRVVRIGHPARLLPAVVDLCLEAWIDRSDDARFAREVRRDIDRALRGLARARGPARRAAQAELRQLRDELRTLEHRAAQQALVGAQVIAATTSGAGDALLDGHEFDLVVIDEAAQATEATCWIPLLRGRRAVLAGDHLQLPPTILSQQAANEGLGCTLFERLIATHGSSIACMLRTQYRMHHQIAGFSSDALYDGRLISHASVRDHLLRDRDGVTDTDETRAPLWFIDTAGSDCEESPDADGESRDNAGEARLVELHVARLLASGLTAADIAVITPYNAQVQRLRQGSLGQLAELEIGSVDGFQGREKEAIVISLVRSNRRREVGFLADARRLNVAITRARRHLAVIGDSATITADPFLARLIAWLEAAGEYRSAFEYPDS